MDFGWEEPKPVTFTVTGKKLEPAYLPSLGAASANVSAIDLLEQGHNMLLLRESSFTQELVEEGGYHQNCLVKLHADAAPEQVAQVEEYLISKGSFITSEELLQNTDRAIAAEMRRNLPLPLFLLVVSFFSLLSVSILLVQKTLPEHGVYRPLRMQPPGELLHVTAGNRLDGVRWRRPCHGICSPLPLAGSSGDGSSRKIPYWTPGYCPGSLRLP